ncbi:MAG: flippase [Ignavibacteriales bacterium]|nr:flippase [Ignavibacteriales bacterium]
MSANEKNDMREAGSLNPLQIFLNIFKRNDMESVVKNTGWLVLDKIFRLVVGLFVNVWIARYLGPAQFGILSYALSFAAIIGAIAPLGLDSIVVRELVKDAGRKEYLLGTTLVLRFTSGIFVMLIATSIYLFNTSVDGQTLTLILIISAGYLFQAFDAIDYWFQSKVKSKFTVIAKDSAFFIISLLKVIALIANAPLIAFAILATVEIMLGSIALWIAYRYDGFKLRTWKYNLHYTRVLLKDSFPLAIASIAIAIYMRIDQVILGSLLGSSAVGIYSAAVRLVEIWYFIPTSFTISIFPMIVEAKKNNMKLYHRRLQQLYDIMSFISILLAIGVTIFSKEIILLFYGVKYIESAYILSIYVWTGVAVFLGVASSQYLMAENRTSISLYRTLLGMCVNVAANIILIPRIGIIGSGIAALLAQLTATFSIILFPSTRSQFSMMIKSLFIFRFYIYFRTRSNA